MQVDLLPAILFVLATVVSVAITFYVKDYLQRKSEYSKLRKRLERIAGKNATVLYGGRSGAPMAGGVQLYKIAEIDEAGITLKNELHEIFVPAKKLIQSEIILPCDDYEAARLKKTKEDVEKFSEVVMPAMFEKMFPAMMNAIRDNFLEEMLEEEGEVSAVIGIKIQKVLTDSGFEIKRVEHKTGV